MSTHTNFVSISKEEYESLQTKAAKIDRLENRDFWQDKARLLKTWSLMVSAYKDTHDYQMRVQKPALDHRARISILHDAVCDLIVPED